MVRMINLMCDETESDPIEILWCARCGRAHSKTEARLRKFFTGFSACCNENLVNARPAHPCGPKVYTGAHIGQPIT